MNNSVYKVGLILLGLSFFGGCQDISKPVLKLESKIWIKKKPISYRIISYKTGKPVDLGIKEIDLPHKKIYSNIGCVTKGAESGSLNGEYVKSIKMKCVNDNQISEIDYLGYTKKGSLKSKGSRAPVLKEVYANQEIPGSEIYTFQHCASCHDIEKEIVGKFPVRLENLIKKD